MPINIAIDGPSGAGKSSAAKELAKELNILYLDTGAMYRAAGLAATRAGVDPLDAEGASRVCAQSDVRVTLAADGQRTWLNGEDVTDVIRTPDASRAASKVATVRGVRDAMLALQRDIARETDVVIDGRDIGTRVLPDAPVKFYITAAPEERARRRMLQQRAEGVSQAYEEILEEIKRRDERDGTRAVDPLRPAPDAVLIDTTDITLEEVVERMADICRAVFREGYYGRSE
ncbi:MAG: (d)CMP kinase [Oscillospiraceae bacterium]|jgi:cytidylate kinase|nr:(d)CMP kinase [Oscillospiraceae bacterium]